MLKENLQKSLYHKMKSAAEQPFDNLLEDTFLEIHKMFESKERIHSFMQSSDSGPKAEAILNSKMVDNLALMEPMFEY